MSELSALNIRITGDASDLKAAVGSATADLGKISTAATAANASSARLAHGLGAVGKAGGNSAFALRGVAQQLSQVGQQTMATGNFVQALAIQLPDIGLAFGAVGAAAGLLAGVALPLLMSAFSSTSNSANELQSALDLLIEKTKEFKVQAQALRLGVDEEELRIIQEINTRTAERIALEAAMAEMTGKALIPLQLQHKTLVDQIKPLESQLAAYRAARLELQTVKVAAGNAGRSVEEITTSAEGALVALETMVAVAPKGGWLAGAISDAQALAQELLLAASAAATATAAGSSGAGASASGAGIIRMGDHVKPPSVGGGGGGGGGVDPIAAELEAIRSALQTEEVMQIESYARQQEALTMALEQRLITQQEYAALMEQAHAQHSEKMAAIDVYRYGDGLQKAGAFFGDLATAFGQGSEKMLRISRVAGAAEALINAWRAYAQTLATPGVNPLAKIAMAAKVLGAGMAAVNAIKSGGGGGGGGGGSATSAAAAAPAPSQTLNFTIQNDPFGYGESLVRQISDMVSQASRSGSSLVVNVI